MKNSQFLISIILLISSMTATGLRWSHPFMSRVWSWNDSSLVLMRGDEKEVWVICSHEVEMGQNPIMEITDSHNVSHVWQTDRVNTTGNKTEYRRYAHFSIPSDARSASRMCDRVMTCTVGNQSAYLYLQVEFRPYIDESVPSVQSGAIIECPIRAPNYPPFEYNMIWTFVNDNEHKVLASGGFMSQTAYFHVANYIPSGSKVTCNLLSKKTNVSASINYVHEPTGLHLDLNSACLGSICSLLVVTGIKLMEIYIRKIRLAKKLSEYSIGSSVKE